MPIRAIIAYLYAVKPSVRNQAVERLVEVGEPALGMLMEVLQQHEVLSFDEHLPGVCYDLTQRRVWAMEAAAQALGRMGEPAVAPLIAVLGRSQVEVRNAVVCALKVIGKAAVPALMEVVQSVDPNVRHAATSVLAEIRDDRAGETLRDLLYQEIAAYRKRRRDMYARKGILISFVLLSLVVLSSESHGHDFLFVQLIVQSLFVGGIFVDVTVGIRRNAIAALSNTTDTTMIGAFSACLSDKDETVRRAAVAALIKLLPQVRVEDRQYVSAEEMNALIRALGRRDNKLTIAILKAFEQIGDEKALPEVKRLAEPGNGVTDEVRKAAEECLPYLRIRAQEARQANTLLRASMPAVAVAPETLLRAAQGIAPVEANQLLRAQASADS